MGRVQNSFKTMENKGKSQYKNELDQKFLGWNLWHVDITKLVLFQTFIHLTSFGVAIREIILFYRPFEPKLDAEAMIHEMITRCDGHWWCSLLVYTVT